MTPEERDALILRMRVTESQPLSAIAEAVGLTDSRVGQICKQRGWLPLRPLRRAPDFRWTERRTDMLCMMMIDGRKRQYMAARLGCTIPQVGHKITQLRREAREAEAALQKAMMPDAPRTPRSRPDKGLTGKEMLHRRIRFLASKGWPPADVARQARCEVKVVEEVLA